MDLILKTSDNIKMQARELFMRYGWKSVSMDDIASKMGISKKTIYQFYRDKESLVSEVVTQIISSNQKEFDKETLVSENAIHEIVLAMEHMSKLFTQMNPSIIFDMQKYYPAAYSIFLKYKNEYVYNKIRENIKRGIKEGHYRTGLDIEIISRYRVESIVIAFNPEFQSNVKTSLAAISNQLSTFFLHGVTNEKGQKLIKKYIHIQ